MSKEAFHNFHKLVLEDISLQQSLRSTSDYDSFVELAIRLGNEHGYDFTSTEVESAINASRRTWLERWIDR